MRVLVDATMPDELLEKWLQHMRDFDTQNAGCHLNIEVHTELDTDSVERALQNVEPEIPLVGKVTKQ